MSTPTDPNEPNPRIAPGWTTPGQSEVRGGAQTGDFPDEAARQRSVDTSQIIGAQVQGTDQLLNTLLQRVDDLHDTIQGFPDAFSSTADHIRRSADATERLAKASKTVADQQSRSSVATEKTANSTAKITDVLKALGSGNLQGAIGELFQGLPGTEDIRTRLSERAAQLRGTTVTQYGPVTQEQFDAGIKQLPPITREEAIERSTKTSKAETIAELQLARSPVSKLTGLAFEGASALLTPAAIYGAYRLSREINERQREALQLGQVTGEGRLAGFAAGGIELPIIGTLGGEVGALRGSPFDLIGDREAREIVQGTRMAGFRGEEARNVEESISGMVNDLGIGVQDAMTIAVPAIKEAGFSTGELASQMSKLDDTAKASRIGIGDLTKSIGDLVTNLGNQSREAAQVAIPTTQALLRQFQGTEAGRQQGIFTGLQQGQQREALAQLSGFAPFQAYTPEFTNRIQADFTRLLVRLAQGKPEGMAWNLYVRELLLNPLYQQLFGTTPIPAIVDMLRRAWTRSEHGTQTETYVQGLEEGSNVNRAERRTQAAAIDFRQQMKRQTEHGILNEFEKGLKSIPGRIILPGGGDFVSTVRDFFGHKDEGVSRDVIRKQGAKAEQRVAKTIDALGLTADQRAEMLAPLQSAVQRGDRSDVTKELDKIDKKIQESQARGEVHTTSHTHVTVGFDPRATRMLKTLNIGAIEAARGERGSQGVTLNP